jgi:hypothetical protein
VLSLPFSRSLRKSKSQKSQGGNIGGTCRMRSSGQVQPARSSQTCKEFRLRQYTYEDLALSFAALAVLLQVRC